MNEHILTALVGGMKGTEHPCEPQMAMLQTFSSMHIDFLDCTPVLDPAAKCVGQHTHGKNETLTNVVQTSLRTLTPNCSSAEYPTAHKPLQCGRQEKGGLVRVGLVQWRQNRKSHFSSLE